MKTMGEVIKLLRMERHLSQEQFANIFNVATSTVGMWETNKRSPNEEVKEAIADYFNVDMNYLYGKTPIRNSYRDKIANPASNVTMYDDTITIPIYSCISCGNGQWIDEDPESTLSFPAHMLNKDKQHFGNVANGDSMTGKGINDGDLLIFEHAEVLENGQVGSFCVDDEYYCKIFRNVGKGMVLLESANDKYDPIVVDVATQCFRVIGKLKFVFSKAD